ncbi:ankyrin repeat domain-containing protein [Leptospira santarosai]|uniref:Ankyrin repeat protein n=1 Tax=Leptospira santarosai str. ZUN179 TaxID=1049985 RepID=M6UJG9_9LEPT|nr:ankyrin repeat domain-containing protein [Leptospira santarosai]EMO44685.1 ankyrin repeat protein [Leptospira santarosai str. ZUN179]
METNLLNSRLLKEMEKYNTDLKKIKDYLKQGADPNCKSGEFGGRDDWDNSPLHIAVIKERLDIVDILLEQGADINTKNREGYTPLYKIPWKRKEGLGIFKFLQQRGADINATTYSGVSLVHYAVLQDNIPILEYLFENGLELNRQTDSGETPLHWTVNYHCLESARYLLRRSAKINVQNKKSNTVLHEAALRGYDKLIRLFLEFGADPEIKNGKNQKASDLSGKEKTKRIFLGDSAPIQDLELQKLVRKISIDQKELFDSLRKETQDTINDTWLKIDFKNLKRTVLKSLQTLKQNWVTNFPDTTAIVFEWRGYSQTSYDGSAFARGYSQMEVLKGSVLFEDEYCDFEEGEVDFSIAFEGIDSILKICDKKEYVTIKNLYNSFLKVLLNEVFSEVFPDDTITYWYFFIREHDQNPFLLYQC